MKNKKLSGPAIFMYSSIVLMALVSAVCLGLYYLRIFSHNAILWVGIVAFMILYHFGLRILFGEFTKRFNIRYTHPWFKPRHFERKLYKILRVRKWKDKVLTFDPDSYSFKNRTLEQLATTMSKSELDHWINEIISVISIAFTFVWGCFPAFIITATLAMLFDAQFIIVQRYNRPIVIKLMEKREMRDSKKDISSTLDCR